jgi:hypothetical protein
MSEIYHFKVLLLCEMMWQVMLNGYWRDMTWLDDDVDIFYGIHAKRIDLNKI